MATPVVVIVVQQADAHSPSTQAMVATARAALGGSTVLVQESVSPPTDEQALEVGATAHADAVVVVTWPDAGGHARLHFRVLSEPKWADRELTFTPADAPTERGRSAGLTIAALVPSEAPPPVAVVPVAPPALPPPRDTPVPERTPPRLRQKEPTRPAQLQLDAAALGSFGFLGVAGAGGGELAVRVVLPELLTFRLGGGVRFGEIDARTEATELTTATSRITAGVVVHAARLRAFELGIGVDTAVVYHSVSRIALDGSRQTHGRFLGAGDLLFDGAYWFDRVALFAAAGVELALGETRVLVGSETLATIPRARGILLLGVRLRL